MDNLPNIFKNQEFKVKDEFNVFIYGLDNKLNRTGLITQFGSVFLTYNEPEEIMEVEGNIALENWYELPENFTKAFNLRDCCHYIELKTDNGYKFPYHIKDFLVSFLRGCLTKGNRVFYGAVIRIDKNLNK